MPLEHLRGMDPNGDRVLPIPLHTFHPKLENKKY